MYVYVYHAAAHENSATSMQSIPIGMRLIVNPEYKVMIVTDAGAKGCYC